MSVLGFFSRWFFHIKGLLYLHAGIKHGVFSFIIFKNPKFYGFWLFFHHLKKSSHLKVKLFSKFISLFSENRFYPSLLVSSELSVCNWNVNSVENSSFRKTQVSFAFSENLQRGFELITVIGLVSRKPVWTAEWDFCFISLLSLGPESTVKHFMKC